jgi:hypothetical protein
MDFKTLIASTYDQLAKDLGRAPSDKEMEDRLNNRVGCAKEEPKQTVQKPLRFKLHLVKE